MPDNHDEPTEEHEPPVPAWRLDDELDRERELQVRRLRLEGIARRRELEGARS